jgi:hypothetical protein
VVVDPIAVVEGVGEVGVVVGPGSQLGVFGGQMCHGVAVRPVAGVEYKGLGGRILLV